MNRLLLSLALLIHCGCHQSPTAPFLPCAKTFSIVSGSNQTAEPRTILAAPLVVRSGTPNPSMFCTGLGGRIVWTVETGGGSISPDYTPPLEGFTARWTLGPQPGVQTVKATASWIYEQDPVLSVTFSAVAETPKQAGR